MLSGRGSGQLAWAMALSAEVISPQLFFDVFT
jgi:hypothetical protein